MRWVHIVCGLIGIMSGAIAFTAVKGGPLHRRIGMIFVLSMVVVSGTGVLLAILHQPGPGNIVAGILTGYLVITAFFTVRRPGRHARQADILAMLVALTLVVVAIGLGLFRRDPPGTSGGYPAPTYFIFAAGALQAALQDFRMISAGGLQNPARLKHHLGRMGGAMLVATISFFLGQPQVFAGGPLDPLGLRVIPVLLIVVAMVYWRVRMSRQPVIVAVVK